MPRLRAPFVLFLLLVTTALGSSAWADDGESLREAAQKQDVKLVKEFLAKNVDVNSKSKYGATALFFAAGKGNLEIVELLLAKGAEVNVTDTFYEATPLTWALFGMEDSEGHRQVALRLLKEKPDDSGSALGFGVRADDLELVKAALATGKANNEVIVAAHAQAQAAEKQEIVDFLAGHLPKPEDGPSEVVELTAEQKARYAGDFKNDDIGMKIKVWPEGDELKIRANDQPVLTLDATGEDAFKAREFDGIELAFFGRGGLIEGFVLKQGGQEFQFGRDEPEEPAEVAEQELPPLETPKRGPAIHWPSFRGDNASGIGDGQGIPSTWDGESGKNIRWKTPVPGIALSSPIVWGDTVFVTSAESKEADETFRTGLYGDVDSVEDDSVHTWKLYAIDKKTGEIKWQRDAISGKPKVKRHLKSSHANPSPVTDGKHVVAHFGSEGMFCYDFDGNLVWKQELGVLNSGWFYDASYEWGFSSSPILHDGRVIIQTDIQKNSYIAAFDVKTGKELWRTSRDEIPTWATPTILESPEPGGVDEVVTNGTTIRGYDAATGKELWTLTPNSEVTVGTPVVADGLAYVTGGYPPARPVYAIKYGARGDLTLPKGETSSEFIAWSVNPGGTYIPSPIVYRGILYTFHNNGRLAAYDAKTGELHYRERVGGAASYSGSPVAADGRLFFTTEDGVTHVVRAGKVYQELGSNELGEVVMTSPAISDGLLIMRGMDHVFAIGAADDTDSGSAASE